MDIEAEIKKLPKDKEKMFEDMFEDVINDYYWCRTHDIDYLHPDVTTVRELLYNEMFIRV